MSVSVFVLSACSGDKAIDPPVVACEDIDEASRTDLLDTYPDAALPAASLYVGNEHTHIKAGVDRLTDLAEVDWRILSAGFGLVRPETRLPAYECTFSDDDSVRARVDRFGHDPASLTRAEQRKILGEELRIPTDIGCALTDGYDLAFVLLGADYLHATGSALSTIPDHTTAFAFAPESSRELVGTCRWVPSTDTERAAHETTWMQVKGRQFRTLAESVATADGLSGLDDPDTVRALGLPTA